MPNLHANLIEPLRGQAWDPDLTYHAPWQSGLTGIAYNAAKTDEVGSFEELLTRADLKGKITLLSEMRDTMGFMLKVTGADPSDFTDDEWANAIDRLRRSPSTPARSVRSPATSTSRTSPPATSSPARPGPATSSRPSSTTPTSSSSRPRRGCRSGATTCSSPTWPTHQANAEKWIDYYYEPEVAAKLAAWVNYICPVEGAREEMEKIDPSLVDNQLIFPDEETLAETFDFMAARRPNADQQYEGDWSDVTGG